MCGFVGWVSKTPRSSVSLHTLQAMNRAISHRGPDDEGYFIHQNLGLGHCRLSIIDTSTSGRQPMFNENETIVAVFNGEIYNYRELHRVLLTDGHQFRSQTDTETLIHAYEKWGEEFVHRLDGMFAFALYDSILNKLVLARDPYGKKPLYVALQEDALFFGSEVKAFLANPYFRRDLNMRGLSMYLAHDYIPAPWSIYEKCSKLRPGHYCVIDLEDLSALPRMHRYWDTNYEPKSQISEKNACDEFMTLFRNAVKKRLMSDVPLGVFLSGGIDSTAVVAAMSDLADAAQIETFSIGFVEPSFDESRYARIVARHFGTTHHECLIQPDACLKILLEVIEKLDEPFADPSILPTYLLSQFAKQHITVALCGDGGDELFAGYDTFLAHVLAPVVECSPIAVQEWIRWLSDRVPVSDKNMSLNFKIRHFCKGFRKYAKKTPEIRNALWMAAFEPEAQRELFCNSDCLDLQWDSIFEETLLCGQQTNACQTVDKVIDAFIKSYLHGDILYKADRASMMHGLELRSPFLDKDLASFVSRLRPSLKMRGLKRKYLIKKCFQDKIPKEILSRKKKGFGAPVGTWLRGPLKELVCDTLSANRLKADGLFNGPYVTQLLEEHMSGRCDYRKELWSLLIFALWADKSRVVIT